MRPENIALLIPITALLIPIVAILSAHQQKMARIFAERQQPQGLEEIGRLRAEVYELKQLVHQQTIQMDNLLSLSARPPKAPDDVSQRIG